MEQKLIFLPALMCDERLYAYQINELGKFFDIDVVIFKDCYTIQEASSILFNRINNEPVSLIGTSMGGYIAMEFIKKNSHLVQKLCLINTTYLPDSQTKRDSRIAAINDAKNISNNQFVGINDAIIDSYLVNKNQDNVGLIKQMVKEMGRETFIAQQSMILSRSIYDDALRNFNKPLLIIGSAEDSLIPLEINYQMSNLCNESKVVIFENCGHLSPLDKPYDLYQVLKGWL